MIIDMHVHPIFQESLQSLSATMQGRQMIQNLEQTSKSYFFRSQKILSLAEYHEEMSQAKIDKVMLLVSGVKNLWLGQETSKCQGSCGCIRISS